MFVGYVVLDGGAVLVYDEVVDAGALGDCSRSEFVVPFTAAFGAAGPAVVCAEAEVFVASLCGLEGCFGFDFGESLWVGLVVAVGDFDGVGVAGGEGCRVVIHKDSMVSYLHES